VTKKKERLRKREEKKKEETNLHTARANRKKKKYQADQKRGKKMEGRKRVGCLQEKREVTNTLFIHVRVIACGRMGGRKVTSKSKNMGRLERKEIKMVAVGKKRSMERERYLQNKGGKEEISSSELERRKPFWGIH